MRCYRIVFCAALLFLTGCSRMGDAPRHVDQRYVDLMTLGRRAFLLSQLNVAQAQYAKAYDRGRLQDDANALYDAGYNLSVVQLEAGKPSEALETLKRLRQDLRLRHVVAKEDLSVIGAASLYRLGRYQDVLSLTRNFTSSRVLYAERMAMLSGLAAFELHDDALLQASTDRLSQLRDISPLVRADPLFRADHSELLSRLALRHRMYGQAEGDALSALDTRRVVQDHRGTLRALKCAAAAAEGVGSMSRVRAYRQRAEQVRNELASEDEGLLPGDDQVSALIISAHALSGGDRTVQK